MKFYIRNNNISRYIGVPFVKIFLVLNEINVWYFVVALQLAE